MHLSLEDRQFSYKTNIDQSIIQNIQRTPIITQLLILFRITF